MARGEAVNGSLRATFQQLLGRHYTITIPDFHDLIGLSAISGTEPSELKRLAEGVSVTPKKYEAHGKEGSIHYQLGKNSIRIDYKFTDSGLVVGIPDMAINKRTVPVTQELLTKTNLAVQDIVMASQSGRAAESEAVNNLIAHVAETVSDRPSAAAQLVSSLSSYARRLIRT